MPRLSIEPTADKLYYVYTVHAGDLPFYVGKGTGARKDTHVKHALNGTHINKLLENKILKELRLGNAVVADVVFETNDEDEAFAYEIKLIAKYGRRIDDTGILTNIRAGGPGGMDEWWQSLSDEERSANRLAHAANVSKAVTQKWSERSTNERNEIMAKIRSGHGSDWQANAQKSRRDYFAQETEEQKQQRIAIHKEGAKKMNIEARTEKYRKAVSERTPEQQAAHSERCRVAAQKRWGKK